MERPAPIAEPGFRAMHGYERPLPELPALDHINEARCLPGRMLRFHAHPTFELCLTVEGRCRWLLADREVASGPGDLFVASPGILHGCRPDARDPNRNLALGFDPGPHLRCMTAGGIEDAIREGQAVFDAGAGFRLIPGCLGLAGCYRGILGELDDLAYGREGSRRLTVAMVHALLVELCVTATRAALAAADGTAARRGRLPERMKRVLAWLPGRLQDPPGLAEMAAQVGLSPGRFATLFRRCTGRTPIEHLTLLRLEAAADRLIGDRTATVAAVAAAFGFCSAQYFSVLFRRRYGRSPAAWRRRDQR